MNPPPWASRYVVAVERAEYLAVLHALPRPGTALDIIDRQPAMCGQAAVFPLTMYGGAMMEYWGDAGTCPACTAAIIDAERAGPGNGGAGESDPGGAVSPSP